MIEVPVSQGHVSQVDDDDLVFVAPYNWLIDRNKNGVLYARRVWIEGGRQRTQRMHSLITGWPLVDHDDHNGLNNQRYNLRNVTEAQNRQNQLPRAGSSSFKGVTWDSSRGRWAARLKKDGRTHHLGRFTDEVAAAMAYDAAARVEFGEFAYLNFPEVAA